MNSDWHDTPRWVRRVHFYQQATFGSGNGRVEQSALANAMNRLYDGLALFNATRVATLAVVEFGRALGELAARESDSVSMESDDDLR